MNTALALLPLLLPPCDDGRVETVATLQSALEGLDPERGFAARRADLEPVLARTLDLEHLARRLAGELERELDGGERAALAGPLTAAAAAAWAGGLEDLEEPRFTAPGEGEEQGVVASRLEHADGAVPLRWTVAEEDGAWRVRELAVDGRSLLEAAGEELALFLDPPTADEPVALADALRAFAARYEEPPRRVIERLQAGLIAAMRAGGEAGYSGRRELLEPLVEDTHDLRGMTGLVVGEAWRALTDEQRERAVEAFADMSVAAYAANFDRHRGERFTVDEVRDLRRGRLVRGRLIPKDGDARRFDYLMRRVGGRWHLVNVLVDGVSDLSLKRTEYGPLVEEKGLEALIERLRERERRYARGEKD